MTTPTSVRAPRKRNATRWLLAAFLALTGATAGAQAPSGHIGAIATVDENTQVVVRVWSASDHHGSLRLVNQTREPVQVFLDQSSLLGLDGAERRAVACSDSRYVEIYRGAWLIFASILECGQDVVLSNYMPEARP